MKKIIPILVLLLLTVNSCHRSGNVSVQEVEQQLKQRLDSAKWKTFIDKTYQVEVAYPDFFEADTAEAGSARFYYQDGKVNAVSITMFVEQNVEGWTIEEAVRELCDSVTTCLEKGQDYYILEGSIKDDSNCLFLEKCYLVGDKWFNLTIYYRTQYKDVIGKLLESVKSWNPKKKTGSFVVKYRQPVNGYQIMAVVNLEDDILAANLTFEKKGQSFSLHTTSFGDTLYNKGQWGLTGENEELMRKYRNQTIQADYHENRANGEVMASCTPFFFRDLDFDGIEELVIVHYSMAVRFHSGYDVYRIVESEPVLIDYSPYRTQEDFGMTDYPALDYKQKTISCPYPEGELHFTGQTIYGISKKQKDTVVVNGRKHYFNHMEVMKEI